jgi:hypothetical protein
VVSSASSKVSGGRMVPSRLAIILLPVPGGPMRMPISIYMPYTSRISLEAIF